MLEEDLFIPNTKSRRTKKRKVKCRYLFFYATEIAVQNYASNMLVTTLMMGRLLILMWSIRMMKVKSMMIWTGRLRAREGSRSPHSRHFRQRQAWYVGFHGDWSS